jgi:hypothetical protein
MIAQISEELVWNQVVARAWCDDEFMQRLLSDPRGALAEHDLEPAPGTDVEVVIGPEVRIEELGDVRRFVLPARPSQELMEEELVGDAVAYYCYSYACGACGRCGCRCRCYC